jgi:hypothetical protein
MPWVARLFVNLMWPFVDPNTKKKVKFGTDPVADGDVGKEVLMKESGGDMDVSVVTIQVVPSCPASAGAQTSGRRPLCIQ